MSVLEPISEQEKGHISTMIAIDIARTYLFIEQTRWRADAKAEREAYGAEGESEEEEEKPRKRRKSHKMDDKTETRKEAPTKLKSKKKLMRIKSDTEDNHDSDLEWLTNSSKRKVEEKKPSPKAQPVQVMAPDDDTLEELDFPIAESAFDFLTTTMTMCVFVGSKFQPSHSFIQENKSPTKLEKKRKADADSVRSDQKKGG
ncbi:hypothetical protein B0H13DRAFT_1900661 [Mycena leptocephala]|nr:hypothetical protein B0H13DRAFT_1900661 [Mycena leptocephala]